MLFGLIKLSSSAETNIKSMLILAAVITGVVTLGSLVAGAVGIYFSLGVTVALSAATMWYARELSLWIFNAKKVNNNKPEGFHLKSMVRKLCKERPINMKVTPQVCIIESEQLNAFATGRHSEHAAIAITTGLLKAIKQYCKNDMKQANRLVEAILCHELGHIVNADIHTKTAASLMVSSIRILSESLFHQLQNDNNRDRSFLTALGQFALFYFIVPFTSTLLGLALSRTREYAADDVAKKCGRGRDLAKALRCLKNAKVKKTASSKNKNSHFDALSSMLCLSNHAHDDQKVIDELKNKNIGWVKWGRLKAQELTSTHPPLKTRIKRLGSKNKRKPEAPPPQRVCRG